MKKLLWATSLLTLVGCHSASHDAVQTIDSCIQPPASNVAGEDKLIAEIHAELVKAAASPEAKVEFAKTLKADFPKLSDRNVSLLLFLRAIECYLHLGVVGEEIARDMAKLVREEWSAQTGFRGKDGPLTPLEKKFIERSPNASEVLRLLGGLGIQ